ncbi:MAG TPA: RnfH family protein [Gammaproteobacteria bacterium]|nr:RnfH family protein [Gammaproteobacteria bacterium]
MNVGVAYADPDQQVWLRLKVPKGSTVHDAIQHSELLNHFPQIDLNIQKVGIFGRFVKLDTPLKDGDRVEIYCPIIADPKTVR